MLKNGRIMTIENIHQKKKKKPYDLSIFNIALSMASKINK